MSELGLLQYLSSWIRKYSFCWLRSKICLTQENMFLSQENFLNFSWVRKIFDLIGENGYFLIQDTTMTSTHFYFFTPCILWALNSTLNEKKDARSSFELCKLTVQGQIDLRNRSFWMKFVFFIVSTSDLVIENLTSYSFSANPETPNPPKCQ